MKTVNQLAGGAPGRVLRRWTTSGELLVGAQRRPRADFAQPEVGVPLNLLAWKLGTMRAELANRETR